MRITQNMQNTSWLSNIILFFPAFFENMLIHPDENVWALGFSSLNSKNSSVTVSSLIKGNTPFLLQTKGNYLGGILFQYIIWWHFFSYRMGVFIIPRLKIDLYIKNKILQSSTIS